MHTKKSKVDFLKALASGEENEAVKEFKNHQQGEQMRKILSCASANFLNFALTYQQQVRSGKVSTGIQEVATDINARLSVIGQLPEIVAEMLKIETDYTEVFIATLGASYCTDYKEQITRKLEQHATT